MTGMRLLTLGVGDAFSARHYSTCFALESGGRWLLIDCPHPIRKIVREGAAAAGITLDVDRLDAVVLTHLHADHASGLEVLGFYFRYVLGRRVPLYTHADVAESLWRGSLAGSMEWVIEGPGALPQQRHFEEFYDLHLMREEDLTHIGPFQVRCRKSVHSVPTIAVKIAAGGRTVGYSADTCYHAPLLEWLADADLIIHEANGGFMHTDLRDLLTAPPEILRKTRIVHCADAFDPATAPLPMMQQGTILEV
jgi:ribonuclease BN (tRNA processing enzyme)